MTSHDITITELKTISEGVEEEEPDGTECAPVIQSRKHCRG